jgi:hypothetical protein
MCKNEEKRELELFVLSFGSTFPSFAQYNNERPETSRNGRRCSKNIYPYEWYVSLANELCSRERKEENKDKELSLTFIVTCACIHEVDLWEANLFYNLHLALIFFCSDFHLFTGLSTWKRNYFNESTWMILNAFERYNKQFCKMQLWGNIYLCNFNGYCKAREMKKYSLIRNVIALLIELTVYANSWIYFLLLQHYCVEVG